MNQLPIGLQAFEDLRIGNGIYVDKTKEVYKMVGGIGKFYFLSRPRRFGKSLLISTLKELFKGNKEIFEGLYIYDKWDWSKKYPVIHLDFTKISYDTPKKLSNSLSDFINTTAIEYSIDLISSEIETRFSELIEKLHKSAGDKVVILIDEYDKPMIDNMWNREVYPEIKRTLHDFYQVLKGSDRHERFVLLTGVSQFSGLSIFSGLNNLNDITMDEKYASICGYTQEELESNFKEHIESIAKRMGLSKEELLSKIKYWYNGYSWDGKTLVYNPFSTLKLFDSKEFREYWYATGTPTFLIEEIKKKNDLEMRIEPQKVVDSTLIGSNSGEIETVALFFQTGYLTIKKKEKVEDEVEYTLNFPNFEVRKAFLSGLLKEYTFKKEEEVNEINKKIGKALKEIK
jgi:DNA-binding Lrp family transcriptional regulator